MHPTEYDPDDNFAQSFQPESDLDEDAAVEALVWQFLLLINPGDEDAAVQQLGEVREALAAGSDPIEAISHAIDWKSGFRIPEDDPAGITEAIDAIAERIGVRVEWDLDDEADDPFADVDAHILLQRAAVELRARGYGLWLWETGAPEAAGWIAQRSDEEAVAVVAGALGFHARSQI
jgi:hypothetical protein